MIYRAQFGINVYRNNYRIYIKHETFFRNYPTIFMPNFLKISYDVYREKVKEFNGRIQTYHFKKHDTIRLALFKTRIDAEKMLEWIESVYIINTLVGGWNV